MDTNGQFNKPNDKMLIIKFNWLKEIQCLFQVPKTYMKIFNGVKNQRKSYKSKNFEFTFENMKEKIGLFIYKVLMFLKKLFAESTLMCLLHEERHTLVLFT